MNLDLTCSALALGLLGLTPLASADVIDWGVSQDTTSSSQVSTNGTGLGAFGFWNNPNGAPLVVNGVSFLVPYTPPDWAGGGGTLMGISTTGEADFDQLLRTARAAFGTGTGNPTGWAAIQLDTLVPLTMGETYEVQVWYTDQRFGGSRDRVMTLSSASGPVLTDAGFASNLSDPAVTQGPIAGGLEADPNNFNQAGDDVFGQWVIGTFTRTDTAPIWLIVQGSNPVNTENIRPQLTAMQIREVAGDPTIGTDVCTGNLNSTGMAGVMSAFGSNIAADNNLTFTATGLPPASFGLLVNSRDVMAAPFFPVGDGLLCIGPGYGRHISTFAMSDMAGMLSNTVDLTALPRSSTPTEPALAGQTWYFQLWHRDGGSSNLTNALEIVFQ